MLWVSALTPLLKRLRPYAPHASEAGDHLADRRLGLWGYGAE